jgi:cation diffusion facilitator CzcD-associated flavoprotein CzcO
MVGARVPRIHPNVAGKDVNRQPRVIVIGAGMSGIAIGRALRQAGYHHFLILEKGDDVGGVWHWNHYPGLTCDVPSQLYQYSFHPKPDWRRLFATGPEIQAYHRDVARRHGVLAHVRFNTEVTAARYTGTGWTVETADGTTHTADFLVAATGVLHHPNIPDIPGMADFAGQLVHSVDWADTIDPRGKRVAVIGTGSTGVQLVSALQPVARRLTNFVRTPQWVLWAPTELRQPRLVAGLLARVPRLNTALYRTLLSASGILADVATKPTWRRRLVQAAARAHLRTVRDPELRAKLTPTDEPLCKRQVVSGTFYRAVRQPNVEVVTDPVACFEPSGIRTADGTRHPLDLVVLATGFKAHQYMRPMEITGRDGLRLDDVWAAGPRAFQMTALPGFPNFFMMLGPNSPVGSVPLYWSAELTAGFVIGWLRQYAAGHLDRVEPTVAATDRFNQQVRDALGPTVWNTGCDSWYLYQDGTVDLWPFDRHTMRRMLNHPDPADFHITKGAFVTPAMS